MLGFVNRVTEISGHAKNFQNVPRKLLFLFFFKMKPIIQKY